MAAATPLRRVLKALAFLQLLIFLILASSAGNAMTSAANSQGSKDSVAIKITINKDDTYDFKFIISLASKGSSSQEDLEESCEGSSLSSNAFADAKASYSEHEGHPTCTFTGKNKVSENNDLIEHVGDEYVLDTENSSELSTPYDDEDFSLSVIFPGSVTDAGGGKINGTAVTFTEAGEYRVTGKDSPSFPWLWCIIGMLIIGAVAGGVWYARKRKKKAQWQAYTVGVAGYGPGQPFAPGQFQASGALLQPPSAVSGQIYGDYGQQGSQQRQDSSGNPGSSGPIPPASGGGPDVNV